MRGIQSTRFSGEGSKGHPERVIGVFTEIVKVSESLFKESLELMEAGAVTGLEFDSRGFLHAQVMPREPLAGDGAEASAQVAAFGQPVKVLLTSQGSILPDFRHHLRYSVAVALAFLKARTEAFAGGGPQSSSDLWNSRPRWLAEDHPLQVEIEGRTVPPKNFKELQVHWTLLEMRARQQRMDSKRSDSQNMPKICITN